MKIEVCYTPELIKQFDLKGKIVVVIDVLRATSCMVAGMGSGVETIRPVSSIEACTELGAKGYIMAGERGGKKVEHFNMGNSPFEYMEDAVRGKKVATTTTNGTKAIELSADADEIIVGAFLNLSAVVNYLENKGKDIVLFCAGWKGRYNLEDSLFAGAVCNGLRNTAAFEDDATLSALFLYQSMKDDLSYYISRSNHAARLSSFGILRDIEYCAKIDEFSVVPKLLDDHLVL
ncbi:2-phosphosulfolactate phosphatase [Roseivirga pacifica]|uniref:Probable 2-phosphosulfolactate phosphatase n=1 Tax=Roseivirga pacifica TaxID=1267423 RepID=A0A1I0P1W5_9BACT|nr:2-phosphosulfolactate phosphatase [Roseivirga pacifica]RKQ51641.1 2-phosphosulfolactate phosphatase [Roseivirga pacifica]SEW08142.1 2-phosphosulfolactate phosphatase [Roseivirga pacifica]